MHVVLHKQTHYWLVAHWPQTTFSWVKMFCLSILTWVTLHTTSPDFLLCCLITQYYHQRSLSNKRDTYQQSCLPAWVQYWSFKHSCESLRSVDEVLKAPLCSPAIANFVWCFKDCVHMLCWWGQWALVKHLKLWERLLWTKLLCRDLQIISLYVFVCFPTCKCLLVYLCRCVCEYVHC